VNKNAFFAKVLLFVLTAHIGESDAVCIDPKTYVSGYKIPLNEEIRFADAIIVGRILAQHGLKEDPAAPDDYTAYNVTIKVLRSLKGSLTNVISVRNENTSARYPMSVGEEHILIVSRNSKTLWINSCGNSASARGSGQLEKQIRAELQKQNRQHAASTELWG
jgi:hypothetical protein